MDVLWDSSRSNSFLWRPLDFVLTKVDDFSVSFSLRLQEVHIGTTPGKPAEFPIAIGLLHRSALTNTNSFRGAGTSATYGVRNIMEWNFFPDAGLGDTWATTVVSSNNVFAYGHNFPLALVPGELYRISLRYTASNQVLRTVATRNGQPVPALEDVALGGIPDFRVDTFSVTSYSDAIQTGPSAFHGSVRARGRIDEVELTVPPPPVGDLRFSTAGQTASVRFTAQTNWTYVLERSLNLAHWVSASPPTKAQGTELLLQDNQAAAESAFYRIRAERP